MLYLQASSLSLPCLKHPTYSILWAFCHIYLFANLYVQIIFGLMIFDMVIFIIVQFYELSFLCKMFYVWFIWLQCCKNS